MNITGFDLVGSQGTIFSAALSYASSGDKYLVKGVTGLDVDEIVPEFYASGAVSKKRFYDYKAKAVPISVKLGLNPDFVVDETFSDLRDHLYKAISADRSGELYFALRDGPSVVAQTPVRVSKFIPNLFTKNPEVEITLSRSESFFKSPISVLEPTANIGVKSSYMITDGYSTAPHGFVLDVRLFTAVPSQFVIKESATSEWAFTVNLTGFTTGDTLVISSEENNKYVLKRSGLGVETPVAHLVALGSVWPVLFPGRNTFVFNLTNVFGLEKLKYTPTYWGV
jgi:hypothetical protein